MERLFTPCTRLYDILESQGRLGIFGRRRQVLQELNLDVSTEELLTAERAFTYADLYAMLGNKDTVAWLTTHVAVARKSGSAMYAWHQLDETCHFRFTVDGTDIIAFALSIEHLLEICDIILRLLAVSVVHSVNLADYNYDVFIHVPALDYMMEQCQSLKTLSLEKIDLDEDQCRVLGAYSRPGLDIVLDDCKITSNGANALAEALGRNQGPTKLHSCAIDNFVLANGLRGNSSLKSFKPCLSGSPDDGNREVLAIGSPDDSNREVLAIAGALKENKGLVDLDLWHNFRISDETWGAVCDSLETHPTLEVLNLLGRLIDATMAPDVITFRIQALLDMLKVNLSIHTIRLNYYYSEQELFRRSVIPYLETNRLRPRLLAIQRTRPIAYRAKVLGRALLAARANANSFWMLLSGNAEVGFPSRRTMTIAAAANLPAAAAAAAATSTASIAADAASVMSTLTTTATGSLPIAAVATTTATRAATPSAASDAVAPTFAAAANVATAFAGQKRKARR
jgi:hypothetical protein